MASLMEEVRRLTPELVMIGDDSDSEAAGEEVLHSFSTVTTVHFPRNYGVYIITLSSNRSFNVCATNRQVTSLHSYTPALRLFEC